MAQEPSRSPPTAASPARRRPLAALAYLALGGLALAGVALSAAFLLVSTDLGRGLVVPPLLALVNRTIAGRVHLGGFHILTEGGLELVDAQVLDPEGQEVVRVDRARVYVDVGRLRSRSLGFRLELERPTVELREGPEGLSLVRAFSPRHPAPAQAGGPSPWTVRVPRLTLRGGAIRWVDALGRTRAAAEGVDADGRALYGPDRAAAELDLRGAMTAPERSPVSLQAAAVLRGRELRVRALRAAVGDTALEALGELDLASWRGRAAVLAVSVDVDALRRVAPGAPVAGDLAGTLYAECDGAEATAALDLAPRGGGGSARAAAALRLPPGPLLAGGDLHLAGLDLSRVLRGAPSTALTLDATGRAGGRDLATLRGAIALAVAPSRVRGGRFGPVELRATADRGAYEVARLEATLPGATARGQGRWRPGGVVGGQLTLDAADLAAARQELARILDRPLPAVSGQARVEAALSGTEAAPAAQLRVRAPRLALEGASLAGLELEATLSGSLRDPAARLDGTASQAGLGGADVRALELHAQLAGRAGEVSLTGAVRGLGPEAIALRGAGALSPDGRALRVSTLTLAWPEARFQLEAPAEVTLAGPSVDRLALASGAQRLTVTGGVVARGRARELDARLALAGLELSALPRQLVPERLGLSGQLSAEVTAKGALGAPEVAGQLALANGAALGADGLALRGEVAWSGPARRLRLLLQGERAEGGALEVRGELPVPLGRAPAAAPVEALVAVRKLPVADAVRLARLELPAAVGGTASVELHLSGTAGSPAAVVSVLLADGRWDDLPGLGLEARLETVGREARLAAHGDLAGARALEVQLAVPLDLSGLLDHPAAVARALRTAPLKGAVSVPGFELAALAGHLLVPEGVAGHLSAQAEVRGTLAAPRADVRAALSGGAVAGYTRLGATATFSAGDRATALEARADLAGDPVLTLGASLGLPLERLGQAAAREAAPLQARLEIPGADLRHAGARVPLTGRVEGSARAEGSLAALRLEAKLEGKGLVIDGHPLGDLAAHARGAGRALHADLHLAVASGGTLDGALDLDAPCSIQTLRRGALGRAPAHARVEAASLDLGFLPAVAPGTIRSAAGKLAASLEATGPLARLVPKGTAGLHGGRAAVAEWGDWTDIALEASMTEDVLQIDRLEARRAGGSVQLALRAAGLSRKEGGDLTGEVKASALPIPHAGQVLATVDLDAKVSGTLSREALQARIDVPSGAVRLPDRTPRAVQSLEKRPDIVVAPFGQKLRGAGEGGGRGQGYLVALHVLAPSNFHVRSDMPRMDVELRADLEARIQGGPPELTGTVQALGGRVTYQKYAFDLKRARAEWAGAGWETGVLDIQALYDNPTARVTIGVTGPIPKPQVKLTSEPPLDEQQIAMLLATGHTELKAGTSAIDAQWAGNLVLQAFMNKVVGDKLPVDTFSYERDTGSSGGQTVRAGRYFGDKIYVGYTLRTNANVQDGENQNEVQLNYRISRQWNLEVRAGDSGSGGASLMWSKDY